MHNLSSSKSANAKADKRTVKRYSCRLKVFNQGTDEVLGYIENISLCGMLINSIALIPDREKIQVWFGADKDLLEQEKIYLSVHKVWGSSSEKQPVIYTSGLYYLDPSDETLSGIQRLIDSTGS